MTDLRPPARTPAGALTPASIAADVHVAETVDLTHVVTGRIPKSLFAH